MCDMLHVPCSFCSNEIKIEIMNKDKDKKTLTPDEANMLLGRFFWRSPFTRHSSLGGPDLYRIVGWTKSRKRVIVEQVPHNENYNADQKWLIGHPILGAQTKGGKKAIYQPATNANKEYMQMDGDFFVAENWVANLKMRDKKVVVH
jgi:hypothetical protein